MEPQAEPRQPQETKVWNDLRDRSLVLWQEADIPEDADDYARLFRPGPPTTGDGDGRRAGGSASSGPGAGPAAAPTATTATATAAPASPAPQASGRAPAPSRRGGATARQTAPRRRRQARRLASSGRYDRNVQRLACQEMIDRPRDNSIRATREVAANHARAIGLAINRRGRTLT